MARTAAGWDFTSAMSPNSYCLGFGDRIRTLTQGRTEVNIIISRKQEHSRKPELAYDLIERCSPGPYLELFARSPREGWAQWGDEIAGCGDLRAVAGQLLENPPALTKSHKKFSQPVLSLSGDGSD